jgi:hypothetical protein
VGEKQRSVRTKDVFFNDAVLPTALSRGRNVFCYKLFLTAQSMSAPRFEQLSAFQCVVLAPMFAPGAPGEAGRRQQNALMPQLGLKHSLTPQNDQYWTIF